MKQSSNTIPAVILGVGGLAVIVALVLAFIPFGTDGSAQPTAAFRAQHSLDDVAFKFGTSAGARYTGKLTYAYEKGATPSTVDFTNLTVTSSNNAEGAITVNGNQAQYRQIGNNQFVSGPESFWTALLSDTQKENLDLAPTDNKWSSARFTTLPYIGGILSPSLLAGRFANTELVDPPTLGAELPAPSKGLPDARFWPTSDPPITSLGEGKVRSGKWEVSYDAGSKGITHVKGEYSEGSTAVYTVDADVTALNSDAVQKVFANARSIVPEITSAPAPGLTMRNPLVSSKQTGPCDPSGCGYDITLGANPDSDDSLGGHVNYALTVNFAVNNSPPGQVGGSCNPVVRVDFGKTSQTRCVATNLPSGGGSIRSNPTITKYLAFLDNDAEFLNNLIDDNENSSKQSVTMVRTGLKKPGAAAYANSITGLPSSYAVKEGDYLFDGLAPNDTLLVTFASGYSDHITNGVFDPNWEGTKTITTQLDEQVKAAGKRDISYWAADKDTEAALQTLVASTGHSDKVTVYRR
ncbi:MULTISPECIES: hypothetical protein [unclassified Gordonia (in: high G+C Gram-positive bacteria)]